MGYIVQSATGGLDPQPSHHPAGGFPPKRNLRHSGLSGLRTRCHALLRLIATEMAVSKTVPTLRSPPTFVRPATASSSTYGFSFSANRRSLAPCGMIDLRYQSIVFRYPEVVHAARETPGKLGKAVLHGDKP